MTTNDPRIKSSGATVHVAGANGQWTQIGTTRQAVAARLAKALDIPEELLQTIDQPANSWSVTMVLDQPAGDHRDDPDQAPIMIRPFEFLDGVDAAAYRAGQRATSMADCPWEPADPAGKWWRLGRLDAECNAHEAAGTMDHTPGFYAELAYEENRHRPVVDPVVEILGGYDRLPAPAVFRPLVPLEYDPATWAADGPGWYDLTTDEQREAVEYRMAVVIAEFEKHADAVRALVAATGETFEKIQASIAALAGSMQQSIDATIGMINQVWCHFSPGSLPDDCVSLGIKVAAPLPSRLARTRELELLADRRRQQRHTNRWGTTPGRKAGRR